MQKFIDREIFFCYYTVREEVNNTNTRIKEVRKEAKLTQTAFAERINLTQNYVALIESGQREPSARTVKDICREFNIKEAWLRFGTEPMHGDLSREDDLSIEIGKLFQSRPDSFKRATITALMRFDPDSPQWAVLEEIYHSIESEIKKEE